MSSTDRIEKEIVLRAPRARVWRALTDSTEFGTWFRVALEGPFVAGQALRGKILYPGYEHLTWEVSVVAIDEARGYFSFRWHPYAVDANVDYSTEEATLVEFQLSETPQGTKLVVIESGFDRLPAHRRAEAFRMNEGGWTAQLANIEAHVAA